MKPRIPSVIVILASILVLLPGMASAYQAPCTVRPVESTPTRLEELEFSVVTQDEWRAFRYLGSKFNGWGQSIRINTFQDGRNRLNFS